MAFSVLAKLKNVVPRREFAVMLGTLLTLIFAMAWSISVTDLTIVRIERLVAKELPLYSHSSKAKWLNYKLLELATRSIERHDQFKSQYAGLAFDMSSELSLMTELSRTISERSSWTSSLEQVGKLNDVRLASNRAAIDGTQCTQWHSFDCTVPVPGVASNAEITVTVGDGQDACDAVDAQGGQICEWMPTRPDEVPEPQPPNLLNKCVCYACKGPLPDTTANFSLPPSYMGSARGTDGKFQCLNDPRYKNQCQWDGLNCVSKKPQPDPRILNSTMYMKRFDSMKVALEKLEKEVRDDIDVALTQILSDTTRAVSVSIVMAATTMLLIAVFAAYHKIKVKYPMGIAFYSLSAFFLCLAVAALAFTLFVGFHLRSIVSQIRDQEIVMQQTAWDVIYYDAILTTSASRFVMTAHNTGWLDADYTGVPDGVRVYDYWFINYIEHIAPLDANIAVAISKSSSEEEKRIFATIDGVNKMLVDLEQISLCSCEPPDASALPANDTTLGAAAMYSPTYLGAKELYNQQNENLLQYHALNTAVKIQEAHSKADLLKYAAVALALLIPLSMVEIFRQVMHQKTLRGMAYAHNVTRVKSVMANTAGHFPFPMVAMLASTLLAAGRFVVHEESRDKYWLKYFDKPADCTGYFILFISHQWLGWTQPDEDNKLYQASVKVIYEVMRIHNLTADQIYIWFDYFSIPQVNGIGAAQNAIDALVSYAITSSAIAVVAPKAIHSGSGLVCNFAIYLDRGWCRAELAAYTMFHGLENFYVYDDAGFHVINDQQPANQIADSSTSSERPKAPPASQTGFRMIHDGFFVMQGNFTCCMRQHPGGIACDRERLVNPMLYLFAQVLHMKNEPGFEQIYDLVMSNKKNLFPRTVEKGLKSGTQQIELFGDLIHFLENMMKDGEISVGAKIKLSANPDKVITNPPVKPIPNAVIEMEV